MRVNHYLAFVVEIGLDKFIVESEHDTLVSLHPFFDVNKRKVLRLNRSCLTITRLQVFPKVLHQSYLFGELLLLGTLSYIETNQPLLPITLVTYVIYFSI